MPISHVIATCLNLTCGQYYNINLENYSGCNVESLELIYRQIKSVIRGSGIGPVMFIVFIDDVAKLLENYGISIKLFADDLIIVLEH